MRHLKRALLGTVLALSCSAWAQLSAAQTATVTEPGQARPELTRLGETSFYATIFHVYDAELWAPAAGFSWEAPFRLKLTYARKLKGGRLVDASLTEMARVFGGAPEDFEALRQPLAACFRDVAKGDTIEGVSLDRNTAEFFFNGEQTCRLDIPDASYQFFSIWLSDRSRSPKQSRRLRGVSRRR